MTGWIDRANDKAIAAEARTALLAAQTVASEKYGTPDATFPLTDQKKSDLGDLASELPSAAAVTWGTDASGKVTSLVYSNGGKTTTYSGVSWE